MIAFAALFLVAITMVGLGHLVLTDPKRRRVLGQSPYIGKRRIWLARILVWAPGIAAAVAGQLVLFVIWLGALTLLGYAIAAAPAGSSALIRGFVLAIRRWAAGFLVRAKAIVVRFAVAFGWRQTEHERLTSHIAALEAQVADLERRLADAEISAADDKSKELHATAEATLIKQAI